MGLLDILNTLGGTSGDPRARPAPDQGTGQATSQGMSPMAKALLALLAIYAMKNMRRADSLRPLIFLPASKPCGSSEAPLFARPWRSGCR